MVRLICNSSQTYLAEAPVENDHINMEQILEEKLKLEQMLHEKFSKKITIMFTDIKSFTTYSSTMTPDQIQNFLAE